METTNKVVEVIDALCEKFGIAVDWTSNNVLPYVTELMGRFIKLEIATSIFWMCFVPMLTLIIFFVTKHFHKKAVEVEWDDDEPACWVAFIGWMVFVALTIASIIVIGVQLYDIIECVTMPEKVIIDYLIPKAAD
jgi:hypothetical protein